MGEQLDPGFYANWRKEQMAKEAKRTHDQPAATPKSDELLVFLRDEVIPRAIHVYTAYKAMEAENAAMRALLVRCTANWNFGSEITTGNSLGEEIRALLAQQEPTP